MKRQQSKRAGKGLGLAAAGVLVAGASACSPARSAPSAQLFRAQPASAVTPATGDWPQVGYDAQHSSDDPNSGGLTSTTVGGLHFAGTYAFGPSYPGYVEPGVPAEVGGVLYSGSADGSVYAVSASTGDVLWTNSLGAGYHAGPVAVVGGRVYVNITNVGLVALDAQTGAVLWTNTAAATPYGSTAPSVVGGVVYVGGANGGEEHADAPVAAVDAVTGATLWTFHTSPFIGTTPVVAGGVVYVDTGFGELDALSATTGDVLWTRTFPNNPGTGQLTSAAGLLFLPTYGGQLYALNPSTGATVWAFHGSTATAPAVARGIAYFGTGAGVRAVQAATGKVVWIAHAKGDFSPYGAPLVAGDVVYAPSQKGLHAFAAADGTRLWSGNSGNPEQGFIVSGGKIFAPTVGGLDVYALREESTSAPTASPNIAGRASA